MNPLTLFDSIAFVATFALIILTVTNRKSHGAPTDTRILFILMVLLILYRCFSNVLEWGGITSSLDPYEDYTELLLPLVWTFLLISLIYDESKKQLKIREARYRAISTMTSDFVYSIKVQKDRTFGDLWIGGAVDKITGYRANELDVMEKWDDLIHPDDKDITHASLTSTLLNRKNACDYRIIRKDGTVIWVHDTHFPEYDHVSNRVVRVYGTVQDATDLFVRSQELLEIENRLNRAQSVAHVGNWEIDLSTNKLKASEESYRIYGYDNMNDELTLERVQEYVVSEDRPRMNAALHNLLTGKADYNIRFRVCRMNDGEIRHIQSHADLELDSDGNQKRVIGTIQDVTELVSLEEQYYQAQKMEAIGQFAGGVAHDINNLMTAITGHGELARFMAKEKDFSKVTAHIDEILKATEKAGNLNRRLLGFSRKKSADLKIIDLNLVIQDFVRMIHRIISEDIQLIIQLTASMNQAVADVSYIEQMIMNLIVNARDAMPKGGTLTVRTLRRNVNQEHSVTNDGPFNGEFSVIEVSDTGQGIPSDDIAKIFEPFYTTKGEEHGTGLGLATVLGVVKQMEGFIQVDSEIEKGSTFRIFLPASKEQETQSSKPITALTYPKGTETVLIVEDDEIVLKLAADVLINHGYKIRTARNGEEALHLIEETTDQIDMVLTDVVMPNLRGPEMVERLKTIHPDIKVLYMSGYAAQASEMIGQDDAFIQKPFTIYQLTNSVRNLLDGVPLDKVQ